MFIWALINTFCHQYHRFYLRTHYIVGAQNTLYKGIPIANVDSKRENVVWQKHQNTNSLLVYLRLKCLICDHVGGPIPHLAPHARCFISSCCYYWCCCCCCCWCFVFLFVTMQLPYLRTWGDTCCDNQSCNMHTQTKTNLPF